MDVPKSVATGDVAPALTEIGFAFSSVFGGGVTTGGGAGDSDDGVGCPVETPVAVPVPRMPGGDNVASIPVLFNIS